VAEAGHWRRWLVTLVACGGVAGAAQAPDEPELRPGVETRVEAPRSGGHFIVYVPTDYAPTRRWPVIFCYHGQNGQPTAQPFKRVLGGKGFIIVGMAYLKRGVQRMTIGQMKEYMGHEAASFARAAAWVEQRLKVDKAMFFCGGFSKGGWTTSGLAEAIPRRWCGVAILGAARQYFETPMDKPSALRGKPIYIGCGTKDPNFPHAEKSVRFYRKHGAKVTFATSRGGSRRPARRRRPGGSAAPTPCITSSRRSPIPASCASPPARWPMPSPSAPRRCSPRPRRR